MYCKRFFASYSVKMRKNNLKIREFGRLLDGRKIAGDIENELRNDIAKWSLRSHRKPGLIAILVGDDCASQTYVNKKMISARNVGIESRTLYLPVTISEEALIGEVEKLNVDASIDGILVQLPLPNGMNERRVCNSVAPTKDVDGFHTNNIGQLCINVDTFVPCTPLGVVELLKRYNIPTFGKNVVVCGRSKNVGLPIALLLHSDAREELPGGEATVTLCHRNTPPDQLKLFTKQADIIVSATGVVNLIKPDMVKAGVCVIDVGINRVTDEEGKAKLVGDVDFEGVKGLASFITPVPGGVGPMTVAMLMKNTFQAAMART